jgi:hypothetical protein
VISKIYILWIYYSIDVHLHHNDLLQNARLIIIISTRAMSDYAGGCAQRVLQRGLVVGRGRLETLSHWFWRNLIGVNVSIDYKSPFMCFIALFDCICLLSIIWQTFRLNLFLNHFKLILKLLHLLIWTVKIALCNLFLYLLLLNH